MTVVADPPRAPRDRGARNARRTARRLARQREQARQQVLDDHDGALAREQAALEDARQVIEQRTDLDALVQRRLRRQVLGSSLLKQDQQGQIRFDEERIARRLEELFLDEIMQGIEADPGAGFLSRLQESHDGVIGHWVELEDLAELPQVEWIQSIILARTRGYQRPRYPHLVTGKYEAPAVTGIDTAIAVDTSLSMADNGRIDAATRTALALRALMRRLSPDNSTSLGHFNSKIHQVTSAELLRSVQPRGGTRTDLALRWLVEQLAPGGGPCLAYIITDGAPGLLDRAVEAARAFGDYPQIMLRVFLVDGDARTEQNVRMVGLAAGESTRVIPIKGYQLACGVVRDVAAAMKQIHDIGDF